MMKNRQKLKKSGVLSATSGTNIAQKYCLPEQGRSMVEMLGVLAIVGVLSVGGIMGYRYAMNKYRANQVIHELNEISHQVVISMTLRELHGKLSLGVPYDLDSKLISSGYNFQYGCGESGTETDCFRQTTFNLTVNEVNEGVCNELTKMAEYLQYIIQYPESCTSTPNEMPFVFEVEGGMADTDISEDEEDEICNEHGSFIDGVCICEPGYSGDNCETEPEEEESRKACGGSTGSTCGSGEYCYVNTGTSCGWETEFLEGVCRNAQDDTRMIEINGKTYIASKIEMDWWSAKRYCATLGTSLYDIEASDFGCVIGSWPCCTTNVSDALNEAGIETAWSSTEHPQGSCYAYNFYFKERNIDHTYRHLPIFYALCQ